MSDDTPSPVPAPPPPAPPPAGGARPPGRLAARIAVAAGALVLLLVLAGVAGVATLWRSEAGTRWLLGRVPGLTVVDVHGSLGGGDLRIGSMRLEIAGTGIDITDLRLQGLRLQARPYPGAWAGVRMAGLSAAAVHVELAPPEPGKPPLKPPTSLRLPVALDVERLHVGTLAIGEAAPLRDIDASLALGADGGAAHRVDTVRFAWERVQAQGRVRAGTDSPLPIELELDAHDAPGPAAVPAPAAGASAPLLAHWQAHATLKGPLEAMALAASLRGEPTAGAGRSAPQADVQARVTPFAGFPVGDILLKTDELDLAAFSSQWPATRLAGSLHLATTKPAAFDAQLRNLAPRAWSAHGLPIAELTGRLEAPWNAESLSVPALRLVLKDGEAGAGELRARGQWADGKADLQLELDQVQLARLDASLGAWRISGPLRAALENLPPPSSLWAAKPAGAASSAAAASGASAPTAVARAASAAAAPTAAASAPAWTAHVTGKLAGTGPPLGSGQDAVPPPPMVLDLDALLREDALELKTFALKAGGATASARGALHRTTAGNWQGEAHASWAQLDPGAWRRLADSGPLRTGPNLLNGALDVQLASAPASWQGLRAVRGRAELTLAASQVGGLPLEGKASLNATALPWSVSAELRSAANQAQVEGALVPAPSARGFLDGVETLHASVEAPDVAAFAPLVPGRWPTKGQARIDVKIEGARNAVARLDAFATPGKGIRSERQPLAIVTEGELSNWAGPNVHLDHLRWSGHGSTDLDAPLAATLAVNEALWGTTHVTQGQAELSGTLAAHTLRLRVDAPVAPPAWLANLAGIGDAPASRLDALVQGRLNPGQAETPQWQEHVAQLELRAIAAAPGAASAASAAAGETIANTAPGAPASAPGTERPGWLRVRPFDVAVQRDAAGRWQTIRLGEGGVDAAGLSLAWQPSFWTAPAAPGQSAHWSFDAALAPFSVAQLMARAQPDMGWHGDLQMAARAHAAFDGQWHVDAQFERTGGDLSVSTDAALTGDAALPLGLTEAVLRLQNQGPEWRASANVAGARMGELVGRLRIETASAADLPNAESALRGTLRARVADLNIWGAWLPPGWRLGGRLRTQLTLAGRLGAPQLTGQLTAEKFEVRNALTGVYAHDGAIDIGLEGDHATIRKFTMTGGNGELSLSGGATLGANPEARLRLEAQQFQLLGRIDRRLVTSGAATLHLTADAMQIEGKLGIDEGLFDVSKSSAPTLDADVDVVQPRKPSDEEGEAPTKAAPPSKAARATTLSLGVDLGEKLRVKGHGIDTLLRGALQITAPGGRLNVRGNVRTEGGLYNAYGQKLDVTRGVLTFTGPVDDPRLDILATRPNLDVIVGVAITGTAQAPNVKLYSEPAMSESDKLSWLMLGRAPDTVGGADAALLQQAAFALLAGEGEAPSDQLMSKLGITDFSLRQEQSEANPDTKSTVVSLGKQLSRRWYVGYEHGINETTGNWQLIYRIAQRFTIRAQTGSDNSLDVIWTWRWN
jgi:translocation and assembly module TamB